MTSSHHEYNSILVLDDEFDIVTIIKHDLERHGFRVSHLQIHIWH